jgi:hypothetical protein
VQCRGTLPSWDEFATENKDLLKARDHVLKEYYTDETLNSELAREIFVLPDRSLAPAKENQVAEMSGTILVGSGREIQRVADDAFVQGIKGLPLRMEARLAFMTRDHHVVRDFVVREMPRQPTPISPQQISLVTGLDLRKVSVILSDLERHLFFLVRDSEGNVSWAFPVTTSPTAHKLTFSSGERTSGA